MLPTTDMRIEREVDRLRATMDVRAVKDILDLATTAIRPARMIPNALVPPGMIAADLSAFPTERFEVIDLALMVVAVQRRLAENSTDKMHRLLLIGHAVFKDGPTYRHLGRMLGCDGYGLRLLAYGSAVGLWKVWTPETLMGAKPGTPQFDGYCRIGFIQASPVFLDVWKPPQR